MYNKKNNYSSLEKKILAIARDEYSFFLNKSYVVAVGLGIKVKHGFYTNEKCIKVFVTKKLPFSYLSQSQIIPIKYKNITTDVVESGPFSYSLLSQKIRPVLGGYSTSEAIHQNSGSIACLVADSSNYYLLSNNHVYAYFNITPLGTPILQPGITDHGNIPKDVIGSLKKYVPVRVKTSWRTPTNYVDCALAKVDRLSLASPKIAFIGALKGVANPKLNEIVQKSGRTTEYTLGHVTALGVTVETDQSAHVALFKDQITTNRITDLGDSGCLLVNSNLEAVGLYFSQARSASVYNPIYKVLSSLHVNIVTQ